MSQTNEPPLEIVEYNIKVKWSDGTEEIIPKDFYDDVKLDEGLQNVVDGFEEEAIDHLKGQYAEEIYGQQEQEKLNESYKQSLANKKEREIDDSSEN